MSGGPTGGIVLEEQLSNWKFETFVYRGSCRISGEPCSVQLKLTALAIRTVPDVCLVETWFESRVQTDSITCEELAVEAAGKFGLRATVLLQSHMHGQITATAGAQE